MKRLVLVVVLLVAAGVGLLALGRLDIGPVVVTQAGEQKLILRLGEVRLVTEPGIAWRIPLVETVRAYDARWLYLDAEALPIQTKDGEQLVIDNFVVWRIDSPPDFLRAFPAGMAAARERIDRVVRDDVREVIGRHTLAEVLKDQRGPIMEAITGNSREALEAYGIAVTDVRINRTELPSGTEDSVYARMRTERQRLAKRNRAEGEERARRIRAEAEREAQVIVANARREAEVTRGEGDAEAAGIYAEAYGAAPSFYAFVRSLEAYRKTIDDRTTLVLPPDSEFFRFLRGGPEADVSAGAP